MSTKVDARRVFERLSPGDLLLVAARPGEGKTRLGLELAAQAMEQGRSAAMFSFEYTPRDLVDRLRKLGRKPERFDRLFRFDGSDRICAEHIVRELAGISHGALVVIDYLQLLDQRRETPPLSDQLRQLRTFATRQGVILVVLGQIDRSFDPAVKALPDFEDVRLPNPLDLSLFDLGCFLHGGRMSLKPYPHASA